MWQCGGAWEYGGPFCPIHRQGLSGAVRAMREAAGDIIGRARSASTGTQGISLEDWARTQAAGSGVGGDLKPPLYWLLIALARTLAEHPSDILLPAEFYSSLRSADDTGCLTFSPTVQQLAAAIAAAATGQWSRWTQGDGKTLASAIAAAVFAAAGSARSRPDGQRLPGVEGLRRACSHARTAGFVRGPGYRQHGPRRASAPVRPPDRLYDSARVRVRLPQRQRRPVAGLACSTGSSTWR